ncbi:MAG: helix-turn-helix domain-containing protein [Bifidobacteriaceae bacterium]|nr:helix-turn-helix domain-containing protein [Bifidobacteriaceae bacterium]
MAAPVTSVYDGTTGRSDHGGRRTHIIQILRDTRVPLSVQEVADKVGIHVNTARFHLESLVDAGLATRETAERDTPGRPKVVYLGTLPNQTHERAQGYRLLAEILTTAIAQSKTHSGEWLYTVGQEWGRYLTTRLAPFETLDEHEITNRLVNKLDALWFAPELVDTGREPPRLLLHNCPFASAARKAPAVVCQLHAGMINASLEEMHSNYRLEELHPRSAPHLCEGCLGPVPQTARTSVQVIAPKLEPPAAQ